MDLWGQAGHLTAEQQKTLEIFKSAASEDKLHVAKFSAETMDQVALRFLRARQFDISKAHDLLHECWATKRDKKAADYAIAPVDETLKCEMTVLRKFYPHNQRGYDKFNRPLLFDNSGTINMSGIAHLTTQEGLVGYHFWTMEKCLDELFTAGQERAKRAAVAANDGAEEGSDGAGNCISTCVILDLQGCSLATVANTAAMNHMKMLIALDNVVYPEMLGKMFVVNAPSFIVSTFAMVKGWLDVRTQKKIELLGSGPEMFARLAEFIDKDQLPVRYGGTATPDIYLAEDTCHPNCEYLAIPYNSMYTIHNIMVPADKSLVVECYIKDGGFEVIVLEELEGATSPAETPSDGAAGVMSRRSKTLFGAPVSIHASQATDHGVTPSTVTKMGEKVLVHTSFRPKVAGESERVSLTVPPVGDAGAAPKLSLAGAMAGGTTGVFNSPAAAVAASSKPRNLRVMFANPSQTMMSHSKIMVYSYRIV